MKKLFALILCVLIFAGCSSENGDIGENNESLGESNVTTTDNISNKESYTFTGIVFDENGSIVVEVCEEYVDVVGETVTISSKSKWLSSLTIGDEVQITVEDIAQLKNGEIDPALVKILKGVLDEKPIIYLYPEKDTVCSVKVDIDCKLTCTYPDHGNDGWQNFIAKPDGTLVFPNGREYYCLYWEGVANFTPDFSTGFCVKGSESAEFLEKILADIGLTEREANEFIIYWLPRLEQNEYNLISFNAEKYCASARLEITPTPDSILRVFMSAKAVDSFVEIESEGFDGFDREGFTVVEWGGCIVE